MDKKKALLTSLATLSLVAAANPAFAEETTAAPVAEPTVATEASPAAEVAPAETPAVEAAPAADAPVADAPAVDAPAADDTPAEETAPAVAASSAGEVATRAVETPAMDVQAIANGDYSSVAGEWVNAKGETISIGASPEFSFGRKNPYSVDSHLELSADGAVVESTNYKLFDANGEIVGYAMSSGYREVNIFIPAGTEFRGDSYYNISPDAHFVAEEDTILMHYMGGTNRHTLEELKDRFYTRNLAPSTEEPTVTETPVTTTEEPTVDEPVVTEELSTTATESTPVVEAPASAIDVPAILAGNFSTISGTWTTADGRRYTIFSDGRVQLEGTDYYSQLTNAKQGEAGELIFANPELKDGQPLFPSSSSAWIFPAGVRATGGVSQTDGTSPATDASDVNHVRIFFGHLPTFDKAASFAYQQALSTPTTETNQPVTEQPVDSSTPAVETPVSAVDVPAILAGDFSSVAGVWENGGETGYVRVVLPDGKIEWRDAAGNVLGINKLSLPVLDERGFLIGMFLNEDGTMFEGGGAGYMIIPVGVDMSNHLGQDASDKTQDRMAFGQNFVPSYPGMYYYRKVASTQGAGSETTVQTGSPTTPVATEGVQLSAGQSQASVSTRSAAAPQQTYSRVAANADKGFLPSTGEAVSVLGLIGAGLSALGLAGIKRRR